MKLHANETKCDWCGRVFAPSPDSFFEGYFSMYGYGDDEEVAAPGERTLEDLDEDELAYLRGVLMDDDTIRRLLKEGSVELAQVVCPRCQEKAGKEALV